MRRDTELVLRAPPADVETEAAVLSAILLNRDTLTLVAPLLKPDDFTLAKHQSIYTAMLALAAERTPPDVYAVSNWLERRNKLAGIGGFPALLAFLDTPVISFHAATYARSVKADAELRRLIDVGGKIAALGYDRSRSVEELTAEAAQLLLSVSRQASGRFATMQQVADDLYAQMESGVRRGVTTGLRSLDRIIGSVCPGDLTIIAGLPGHGKSVLALQVAEHVASTASDREAHHPAAIFSFEMARTELAQRLIATRAGVPVDKQRAQRYDDDDTAAIYRALGEVANLPLLICDERGMSIQDVRAAALQQAAQTDGLSLVVVDYITLIETQIERGSNQAAAVGAISRGLKRLAREANCPVVALSQLNRDYAKRAGFEPELSDLRDSGQVEQDADQVVFVVQPQKHLDPDKDRAEWQEWDGKAKLFVKKNRHGATGVTVVRFDGPRMVMHDLTYRTIDGYDDARADEDGDDDDNR